MNKEKAREKISREAPYIDIKPYSHNIIGIVLSSLAKEEGIEAANSLIDEFSLENKGWRKRIWCQTIFSFQ